MVNTRSGHKVVHVEASYGRASRKESKRCRQKRKLNSSTSTSPGENDGVDGSSTPQRRRTTRAQIQELTELATPPSASTRVATTPPAVSTRLLRGKLPRCSDFGLSRHFAFEGQKFFFVILVIYGMLDFQIAVRRCLQCREGMLVLQVTCAFRIQLH